MSRRSISTACVLSPLFAAALLCGSAPATQAQDQVVSQRPQGASRTMTMADLCGDCKPEKFVQCGDFLEGPAFDDQGNLWIVSIESGNIEKVTPNGQCTTATKTGGRLYGVDRKRGVFTIDPPGLFSSVILAGRGQGDGRG